MKLPGLYGARSIESGRAAGYFVDEMLAWAAEGSLVPISGLRGFSGVLETSPLGRAKADVGWLVCDSWTVPFEGQGPLEPEKTKSQPISESLERGEKRPLTAALAHRFMYRTVCDLL